MKMIDKINRDDFTCNYSFINEYIKFLNNIPDILISNDTIDLSQHSETQEIVNNIIDLNEDYKLDNNKNIKLNLPKNENVESNTQEIVNNLFDLEVDYKLENNKNIELNLATNSILNTEIEGTSKETKNIGYKREVLENFETSLDDVPKFELEVLILNLSPKRKLK
ncbi:unnamed protein product [Pieris brassicae]|uniref:Uncharacterized protein n=1 Tax=Pieris brassicae TaxID=7116 RepID=A0A9P0TWC2_PIEBR|nr:unnamed protein product [Pieris brassicae]